MHVSWNHRDVQPHTLLRQLLCNMALHRRQHLHPAVRNRLHRRVAVIRLPVLRREVVILPPVPQRAAVITVHLRRVAVRAVYLLRLVIRNRPPAASRRITAVVAALAQRALIHPEAVAAAPIRQEAEAVIPEAEVAVVAVVFLPDAKCESSRLDA